MVDDPETIGLGSFPLGPTAMGSWSWEAATAVSTAAGVRILDPSIGDYAHSAGTIERTTPAKQRVVNLLVHRFGSSMGVRGFKSPEVHDENTERFVDSEVRRALVPAVADGSIIITRIVTIRDVRPGKLGIGVHFIDTQTGEQQVAEA